MSHLKSFLLTTVLDIRKVPSCLLCGTFRDFVHETNFWMSSGGTRSVIHYDADENLHCIINGSKDFMMMKNKYKHFLPSFEKVLSKYITNMS